MNDIPLAVRTHLTQLHAARDAQAHGVRELEALPVSDWPAAIAADETLRVPPVLDFVLDRAKQELDNVPNFALQLTTAVIGILVQNDPALLVLRGRALNTHAQAVRETGDVLTASTFITAALALLASDPAGRKELQSARIFAARIMYDQGNPAAALQLLHEAARESEAMGNARVALQANMTHAGLLLVSDAPREVVEHAEKIFAAMLPVAEALGDERERARILSDLGGCARRLDDHGRAIAYYTLATPLYVKLGMVAEAQRLVWGMAPIIAASGRVAQAVAALRSARDEFLGHGALLEAALVSLDLLSLLLIPSVEGHALVPRLAAELVSVFNAAGMPAPALRAWKYLQLSAQRNKLDEQALRHVRAVQKAHLRAA